MLGAVSPARALRAVVVLLADAVSLVVLSALLPGFELDGTGAAIVTAVVIGTLNALVWPVLARFTLPLNVMTLGLATLVLNGVLIAFAIDLAPGAEIKDFWTGVVVALGIALLTTLLASLLAIDEDDSWYRNVVRRQARRRGDRTESDVPGVIFLEIDGLAHEVLRRAMRDGNAPTLARWLRDGSAGRPTGRRRPAPARPACCTATTTTCPPFAGGRRTAGRRSSRTTRGMPRSSSGGIRTGAACCTPTEPAARTSSRATPPIRCSR
jgi:uncharacterized membrane protein YvlD (DUF360 family)